MDGDFVEGVVIRIRDFQKAAQVIGAALGVAMAGGLGLGWALTEVRLFYHVGFLRNNDIGLLFGLVGTIFARALTDVAVPDIYSRGNVRLFNRRVATAI